MLEINNTTRQKVNQTQIRYLVQAFLVRYHKTNYEVSVAIIGAVKMRQINKKYRQQDKSTDVLSFRGGEAMNKFLGEVIINIQETKQITKYRALFTELGFNPRLTSKYLFYFLLIHGLLHLVGYNDETELERRIMIKRGVQFLEEIS